MNDRPINLGENWTGWQRIGRRVVARMNDYPFKVVKVAGEFVWHDHPATGETFLVLDGRVSIGFRDGAVAPGPGE